MPSFLERMKARMTGSLNKTPEVAAAPLERHREIVRANRWDERDWLKARKTDPVDKFVSNLSVGDAHKGGERQGFDAASELSKAMWLSLYKAAPQLAGKRELDREVHAARKIVQELQENPKLRELQEMTAGDPLMATIALDAMSETVCEVVGRIPPPPPPPQPKQKQDPADPNAPQLPGGNQPGDGAGQEDPNGQPAAAGGDGEAPEGDDGADEDLSEDADTDEFDPEAEQEQAELDWEKEFDDQLADLDLERVMNKALDKAQEEAGELESLRKGIGLEDGDWRAMSPEERMAMADRLRTKDMKALAEAIGRMKRFALGVKASRVIDVPHEAYDVETGNDIARLLKSEFALLGHPHTVPEFYRRYADKELLQFKMRGHEEVGKGPIVIAIDKSGSMSGQPFTWAMAVAEALRRFAAEEERDYFAMFFGSNNDRNRFDFPKGKGPFEKVMTFLSVQANGGPLRVDQRIATPQGWKLIGKAQVGDQVFGPDGKPVEIIGVYPQGELDLHRVHFEDGSSVVCDKTHLWTVERKAGNVWKRETLHLSEILERGLNFKDGRTRFRVPITGPLEAPEIDLPVEPYLLGYMLGDGSFHDSPTITTSEDEEPWREGIPGGLVVTDKEKRPGQPRQYRISMGRRGGRRDQNALVEALKSLGLWRKRDRDKFIPEQYLWASREQRLALLQGLLDTDGSTNVPGNIFYYTTSQALADGVVQLMQSLGGLATVSTHKDKRPDAEHWHEIYTVNCRIPQWMDKPYRLKRRLDTFEPRHRPLTRPILNVTYEGPDQAICIKVDRQDGLFLTEGMVVTHNTQFDGVLTEALQKASKAFDGEGKGKADIVFITDGMSRLDDKWIENFNKERERTGVRVYSIYIGGAYDMNSQGGPTGLLNKISDIVIPVKDLKPEAAKEIFAHV